MIQTSSAWKEFSQYNDVYHIRGSIAKSGTTLTLTDEDFMFGTVKVTDATSSSNTFDIGAVITNTFECTLNNYEGKFDGFDFDGAVMTIEFGVVYADDTEEWIQRGVYRVDKPDSLGSTIQVKAFDYMDKLNRYYALPVTYPINAKTLVENMCTFCGVSYDNDFWDCASNPSIAAFEFNESITCRAVLNWICQICGVYARVNNEGKMTVKWYHRSWGDSDDLNGGDFWANADTADGGTINPWSVVADYSGGEYGSDWIASQVKSITVGIDNITITGIRAYQYNTVDEFHFAEAGNSGYILKLENNPLITADNLSTVANRVYSAVGGMAIQPFKASIYGDPSMEAGDSISIQDYRGNFYNSFITNLTFAISGVCEVSCGAETPNEKDLEFTNPTTGVIQGATRAAYDYITVRKLDGDVINANTLNIGALDSASREEVDTANGQITTITGGGISVHEEGDTANAVTIKSSGVGIVNNSNEVAKFGQYSNGSQLDMYDGVFNIRSFLASYYRGEISVQPDESSVFPRLQINAYRYDRDNDSYPWVKIDEYIDEDNAEGILTLTVGDPNEENGASIVMHGTETYEWSQQWFPRTVVQGHGKNALKYHDLDDGSTPPTEYNVFHSGNLIPTGDAVTKTAVNVASGGSGTEIGSQQLKKGVWTLKVQAQFAQDGTGRRAVWLTETSGGGSSTAICIADNAALSSANTYLELTLPVKLDSAKTYHVVAYQNSGSPLSVQAKIFYSGFEIT